MTNTNWEAFKISELFNIIRGNAKDITTRSSIGNVALLSASDSNNGFKSMTTVRNNENVYEDCLTINNNGSVAHAYFHPYKFVASSDVTVLVPYERLTTESALFLVTILNQLQEKYSYGYKLSNVRIKKQKILLPVDEEGNIDYRYMDEYIYKIKTSIVENILIKEREKKPKVKIEPFMWEEFWLPEVVTIKSGIRLTKANQIPGNIAFIGASDKNNGITNFVGNKNKSLDKNILGVNYNGSVVENFYHPYEAVFSDDVKRLEFKEKSLRTKNCYLFLKQMILQQKIKYAYGYKFNGNRMSRQKIMLPVNKNYELDGNYMENFIANIISEKENIVHEYYKKKLLTSLAR